MSRIAVHMNDKTRSAMAKMHDTAFFGSGALQRCLFNLCRSNESTSYITMFGVYAFVDSSLSDGEIEIWEGPTRLGHSILTIENNPYYERTIK